MRTASRYWRLWQKALGSKEGETDDEADIVSAFRSLIVGINFICAIAIIVNIVHKW